MAYATAEQRHAKQATHTGSFSVEQKLQSYLRDKFSPESINRETCVPLLKQVARDYDSSIKVNRDDHVYTELANEAIDTYLKNWEGKTPGEDNRGQRLNKAVLNTLLK